MISGKLFAGLSSFSRDVKVEWYSDVADVCEDVFSVFIGNEFLDALPVHQFVRHPDTDDWRELVVGIDGGTLQLVATCI